MVNPGGPSKGCYNCRERRVKCDEQRPRCGNCCSIKRQCLGYRDGFRHQNGFAQFKVEKRVAKRDAQLLSEGSRSPHISTPSLAKPVSIPVESLAIPRFYSEYVHSKGTSSLRALHFLPASVETAAEICPLLWGALTASALANIANQLHQPDILPKARHHYVKVLYGLRRRLCDPEYVRNDNVIVTIFLLGIYEVITAESRPGVNRSSHLKGALAIFEYRGWESVYKSEVLKDVLPNLYYEQLIECLTYKIQPSAEIVKWVFGRHITHGIMIFTRLVMKVAEYCCQVHEILKLDDSDLMESSSLIPLIKTGKNLDQELSGFWLLYLGMYPPTMASYVPTNIPPNQQPPQHVKAWRGDDALELCDIKNPVHASLCAAILSAIRRARYIDVLAPISLISTEVAFIATLKEVTDEICATIPWALGEVDSGGRAQKRSRLIAIRAYSQLWPLRVALYAETTTKPQKNWIIAKLRYIGNLVGIKQAFAVADKFLREAASLETGGIEQYRDMPS